VLKYGFSCPAEVWPVAGGPAGVWLRILLSPREVRILVWAMWQKLVVLGSQKLWELRDAIICPSDEKLNSARLRMSRPSAFFYIEGVFYNDMRHPDAIDISEPIRKFCEVAALDAPRAVPPTPFADPPVETDVEGVCPVLAPQE
jgi:hypothetical protein